MSEDNSTETKKDDAGVRFPFISLEKAIGRAQELYEADKNGREMVISVAFSVWQYSEKSSGGHQTIGALKMYGLLKDEGANNARKVALTSEALRFFKDEREEERIKLKQFFALKPKLISALWGIWGDQPPTDTVARSHLKIERGISEQGARSLLGVYKENLAFCEFKGHVMVDEDAQEKKETNMQSSPEIIQPVVNPVASQTLNPVQSKEVLPPSGSRRAVFALTEGDVTITFPEDLSPESVSDLADYIEIFLKKAKREAGVN